MVTPLYNKCLRCNFEKLFKQKGYAYFTKGAYNLNIIGVRKNNNNQVTNLFDDYLVVIYKTPNGMEHRNIYSITTEPGLYYMTNSSGNKKGTAILVPGQYRGCWEIGKHKGKYTALCQKKPVKVYRDGNYDKVYNMKPETIQEGVFGINIHRSNEYGVSTQINKWSAGCQVFSDVRDYNAFMYLCKNQADRYGNNFTYTLIKEEDLI